MHLSKKTLINLISVLILLSLGSGIGYLASRGVALAYLSMNIKKESSAINTTGEIYVTTKSKEEEEKVKNKDTLSIGFAGDIVPGLNAPKNIFHNITPYAERPDIMIGNLEGVVTNHEYSKCKIDSKNCFSFNGDTTFLQLLKKASFDILNIANNHFNDYDNEGQKETIAEIYKAGMIPSGLKDEIVYINKNGFKIAILGFSNYFWTTDINNTSKVTSLVNTANEYSDIVIVVFHGGGEGVKYVHTPIGVEWYLNENRGDLRNFAHNAIDSGADLVLGSGPHVLRGIEKYDGKIIAYSLGNFASANSTLTSGLLKNSAMLEIVLDKKGSINSLQVYPFEIETNGIPKVDQNNLAIKIINELSKSDFGVNSISLDENGRILFK